MFLIVPTGRGEDIMNELVSKEDYEEILNWHYEMERDEDEILVRPTCAPQYYRIWHEEARKRVGIPIGEASLFLQVAGKVVLQGNRSVL